MMKGEALDAGTTFINDRGVYLLLLVLDKAARVIRDT